MKPRNIGRLLLLSSPSTFEVLWQEAVGLDVSHRKYSTWSGSYFMRFVSEQAFGNKGNGGSMFKGKARRSASALLVSELWSQKADNS